MTDDRLTTDLWVAAHLRTANQHGVPMVVVRRGDRHRGAVMVKLHHIGLGWSVLTQVRRDQRLGWLSGTGPTLVAESEADRYLERQVRYDPDVWVIEVEDRHGRHWFDGPRLDVPTPTAHGATAAEASASDPDRANVTR